LANSTNASTRHQPGDAPAMLRHREVDEFRATSTEAPWRASSSSALWRNGEANDPFTPASIRSSHRGAPPTLRRAKMARPIAIGLLQ
jgi:hypothetical protein